MGKRGASKSQVGYVDVYEDPEDYLKTPPAKRTRQRFEGDMLGEFLVFGDQSVAASQGIYKLEERLKRKGYGLVVNALEGRTTCLDDPILEKVRWYLCACLCPILFPSYQKFKIQPGNLSL